MALRQRDPEANETVLSGDLGVPGDRSDNACHVVTGGAGALIDGFTIRLGRADCPGASDGGGLLAGGADLRVAGCVLEDNEASGRGGGLYAGGGTLVVSSTVLRRNAAGTGGGAAVAGPGARATFDRCTFEGNGSSGDGGGLAVLAGAAAEVVSSLVTGNEAAGDGGGVHALDADADLSDTTLSGNGAAGSGGGAAAFSTSWISSWSFSATRCIFRDNEAGLHGGGYAVPEDWDGPETLLERCAFHGNVAGASGGGAAFGECNGPTARNCAFVGNLAGVSEGGLRSGDGECWSHVHNSIIWGNAAPAEPDTSWFRCRVWRHNVVGGTECDGENHNVDLDPRLVNVDPAAGPVDLYPLPTSPCIDAGYDPEATTVDLVGTAWVDDPLTPNCDGSVPAAPECSYISDIGLYEYVP